MIPALLTVTSLAALGATQFYSFQQTKDAICSLTKQYSQLSDENKQDLANSILLQQQFEQLASNLSKLDLKNIAKDLQDLKTQIQTQKKQYDQIQQQQQTDHTVDDKQYKSVLNTITQIQKTIDSMKAASGQTTTMQTGLKSDLDKLNISHQGVKSDFDKLNTSHQGIKSDLQKLGQSTTQTQAGLKSDLDKLQIQFTQLQQQQGVLTNSQKSSIVQSPQQGLDQSALMKQYVDLKTQIDGINTKIGTMGQVSQALGQTVSQLNINTSNPGTAKLNIGSTGTKNPDMNGIYVLGNDNAQDAIMTLRGKQGGTGNPYTAYDHENVTGWSTGLDKQNNNNYSIKPSWGFDSDPVMSIDKTGKIGVNQKTPTFNLDLNQGNAYMGELNVNQNLPQNLRGKINVGSTGQGNPDTNGIYVVGNDNAQDAVMTLRGKQDGKGNPYTAYDHQGVQGWSTGLDKQNNNNFSIKPKWGFDGDSIMTIDKTGKIGVNQKTPTFNLDLNQGNAYMGELNINQNLPQNLRGKMNVGSTGQGNPDTNGVYIRAPDQKTDALMTVRVPNGSKGNPAITFDHDQVAGYQMGVSTALGNPFIIARNWNDLGKDPALRLEQDGGITFFTDNFRVCKRGGDYKNCKQYNPA